MEEAYVVICVVEHEASSDINTLYSFPYATKTGAEEAMNWFKQHPGVCCRLVCDIEQGREE